MRVLVVEDDFLIRMLLIETLQEAGFEVTEAETGELALQVIRQATQPFTILVTDYHMPGAANGLDVAAAVRQRWPDIPVVIASGRHDVFQRHWRDKLGYRLLSKPYRPSHLVNLAHELLG